MVVISKLIWLCVWEVSTSLGTWHLLASILPSVSQIDRMVQLPLGHWRQKILKWQINCTTEWRAIIICKSFYWESFCYLRPKSQKLSTDKGRKKREQFQRQTCCLCKQDFQYVLGSPGRYHYCCNTLLVHHHNSVAMKEDRSGIVPQRTRTAQG